MTHGFCVDAQSSLSSPSHNSSAAWFQDQWRLSASSTSASTPSTLNHSDGAFGSFNISPCVPESRKRRQLSQSSCDSLSPSQFQLEPVLTVGEHGLLWMSLG